MNGFPLLVTAVDRMWFQGTVTACTVRTTTGCRTFEARHEPFAAVVSGEISIVGENGDRTSVAARDGLLLFDGKSCVITIAADLLS